MLQTSLDVWWRVGWGESLIFKKQNKTTVFFKHYYPKIQTNKPTTKNQMHYVHREFYSH